MSHETLRAKLIKHVRLRVFRGIVFCRDLSQPLPPVPNPSGARVEQPDQRDLEPLLAAEPDSHCRRLLALSRQEQTRCYVARVDGRLAGITFAGPGPIVYRRRLILNIDPPDRYNFGSYVLPEFRGRKVFHQVMTGLYRGEAAAGVRRLYSWVEPDNGPSIRTHLNLGAVPIFQFRIYAWMLMNLLGRRRPIELQAPQEA